MRSQLSPVIYRVARDGDLSEVSVHLGRIKAYHNDESSSVPDYTALDDLFSLAKLPYFISSVLTVHIDPYTIKTIESHKRWSGEPSLTNFVQVYYLLVEDKPSNLGICRHVNVVPQCHEMIRAYRLKTLDENPHSFGSTKS